MKRKPKPEKPMREYTPGEAAWLAMQGVKWAMPSARATRSPTRAAKRLGHAAGIAIAALSLTGCGVREFDGDEFTVRHQGWNIYLITDRRTSCEYLWSSRGGFILRSDGYGNVTPNCAGSHGYAQDFPYAKRPDQTRKGGKK